MTHNVQETNQVEKNGELTHQAEKTEVPVNEQMADKGIEEN